MSLAPDEPPAAARSPLPPPLIPSPEPGGFAALVRPAVALLFLGFTLWLVFAVRGYRDRHAQAGAAFQIGGHLLVEIKLARDTLDEPACASGASVAGLACAHRVDKAPRLGAGDEEHTLRPYQTVRGETLLGAGLFRDPALRRDLPEKRFTVVCNLHVQGVVKSPLLRWRASAPFVRSKTSLAAGTLQDCAVPR